MAININAGTFVSSKAKQMKPKIPTKTDPIIYMRLRPMRSDRCPATGTQRIPDDGLSEDGHQNKIARSAEHRRSISENEGADDIGRGLLRHPQQRGQRDLLRLTLEHFQDRHTFNAFFVEHLLEDRGLGDAEPDPQTDPNHDNAEKERNPPSAD